MVDRRRISKLLSLILRHRPDEFGLNIDEYGFIPLDEVVEVVQERYDEATEEAVRELVSDSRQHRFEIVDERIRALYGHSFFVEMDGESMAPPDKLYMGTTVKAGALMRTDGINPVDRSYLHLSTSFESAESRSRQVGTPCVAEVLARRACDDGGIEFYARGEVILTRAIPPEFVGDVHGLDQADQDEPVEQAPRRADRHQPPAADRHQPPAADRHQPPAADTETASAGAADVEESKPAAFGRRPRKITGLGRRG